MEELKLVKEFTLLEFSSAVVKSEPLSSSFTITTVGTEDTPTYAVKNSINVMYVSYNITPNKVEFYASECPFTVDVTTDDIISGIIYQYHLDIQSASAFKEVKSTSVLEKFAFKCPVLIEGDRGSGKTYEANAIAKKLGAYIIRLNGHPGMDAIEMLGCCYPVASNVLNSQNCLLDLFVKQADKNNQGQLFVWKDGALTRAYRLASQGKKVILIFDELLRVNERELNVLLSALTPIDNKYILPTGRIERIDGGAGVEEVIECPVENLWIIATTNTGYQFSVGDLDPALQERFLPIRKDTTYQSLEKILKINADSRGFDYKETVTPLLSFYERMQDSLRRGLVDKLPTVRTLSRCILLASCENDVKNVLAQQTLYWCKRDPRTGKPDEREKRSILKYIYDAFLGLNNN